MSKLLTARELKKRITENDNRCTARPYALLLRSKIPYTVNPEYESGRMEWVEHSTGDYLRFPSKNAAIKHFREIYEESHGANDGCVTDDDIVKYYNIKCHSMGTHFVTENVFLTDAGYEDHKKCNGHNLGDHDTYGIHLRRNKEIESLLALVDRVIELEDQLAALTGVNTTCATQ